MISIKTVDHTANIECKKHWNWYCDHPECPESRKYCYPCYIENRNKSTNFIVGKTKHSIGASNFGKGRK